MTSPGPRSPSVVFFDFGGVLAEEGFRGGLLAIARKNALDPENFFSLADETILQAGYTLGRAPEAAFWQALRERAGIVGTDAELREEILSRFTPRPWMFAVVARLSAAGARCAILSDQTDWLEELDRRHGVFSHFERVFNSYRAGRSKREAAFFREACEAMGVSPADALFVDDRPANVERAAALGMKTILYRGRERFLSDLAAHFPALET